MKNIDCHHQWSMTNLLGGYLVIEGCRHCLHRISFFSQEPVPPKDTYQEGAHYWKHLAGYQASQFDLKCEKCGGEVQLKEVMALMLCMKCNPECDVYVAGTREPDRKTWVYAALCADTSHAARKCIPSKSLKALNEYFNKGIADPAKSIVVVPCRLRKSVDMCQGIVLADVGLTELY